MDKDEKLEKMFSKLYIKLDEYSKVKELVNVIKNDNNIQNNDKFYFLNHINNIYFNNEDINKKNINKNQSEHETLSNICKKCEKHKFKKYEYCYKHCQEENIIPKDVKRKDYDNYIKNANK